MKNIGSWFGGAVVITENAGVFSLVVNESVGGGLAAGVVKGSAEVILDAASGLKLAEALLNSHLPAAIAPMAAIVEAVVNQAVVALE